MSHREKIDKLTDGDVPPTALGLLRALIEANQNQAQALEALKQRMEAEAHEFERKGSRAGGPSRRGPV